METTDTTERSEEEEFLIEAKRWAKFAHRAIEIGEGTIPHRIEVNALEMHAILVEEFGAAWDLI